jgi:hypothetical protein
MRMLGLAERAIRALAELQLRPERRFGRHGIQEPEILGIETEIKRLSGAIRQIEAVADELRLAHATNR